MPRSGDAEPARAQVRGELGAAPAGSAAGTAGALGLERGSFGQGSFGQGCLRQSFLSGKGRAAPVLSLSSSASLAVITYRCPRAAPAAPSQPASVDERIS